MNPNDVQVGDRFTRSGETFEVVHVTPIGLGVVPVGRWHRWLTVQWGWAVYFFAHCTPIQED